MGDEKKSRIIIDLHAGDVSYENGNLVEFVFPATGANGLGKANMNSLRRSLNSLNDNAKEIVFRGILNTSRHKDGYVMGVDLGCGEYRSAVVHVPFAGPAPSQHEEGE